MKSFQSYPQLLLLLSKRFVLDSRLGQLSEGSPGLLQPWPEFIVRLPELAG